jgi:hypothetical protein
VGSERGVTCQGLNEIRVTGVMVTCWSQSRRGLAIPRDVEIDVTCGDTRWKSTWEIPCFSGEPQPETSDDLPPVVHSFVMGQLIAAWFEAAAGDNTWWQTR